MLDLDLLRSFVSVVDAGGFTRAGERVNRTQSTVSQQIRRLEADLGHTLLTRDGRGVALTAEGERFMGYARRLLALAGEARASLAGTPPPPVVRLGIPDDFAIRSLTGTVAAFARERPDCRLSVRCGLSVVLEAALARGELDVALVKRRPDEGTALAVWPEVLTWIGGPEDDGCRTGAPAHAAPLPLIAFPPGCLYRDRMIRALEAAGRDWRIAYESPSLLGLQAALSGGLGITLLDERTMLADHRRLGPESGLPPMEPAVLALIAAPDLSAEARAMADVVARFCDIGAGARGGTRPAAAAMPAGVLHMRP